MKTLEQNIAQWLEPILEEMDLFLVEVSAKGKQIQVYVDGMNNVLIDDCARINRHLQERLDSLPDLPEDYKLDVSSPGMTNPLRVPLQYKKRIGQALRLTCNGEGEVLVRLLDADEEGIRFIRSRVKTSKNKSIKPKVVEKKDAEEETVKYTDIAKAVLYLNF